MSILTTVLHSRGRHQPPSLPNSALHPKIPSRSWSAIPLGAIAGGDALWHVDKTPHAHLAGSSVPDISSVERNVLAHLLQYRNHWEVFGIDLSALELVAYADRRELIEAIAEDVGSAVRVLRHVENVMFHRYESMQKAQVNHFDQLLVQLRAIMVVIHDAHRILEGRDVTGESDLTETTRMITGISRLGRAAGVHLLVVTPQKAVRAVHGELKQNLGLRIAAGHLDTRASRELLGDDSANFLPQGIEGRGYIQTLGNGQPFQGYRLDDAGFDEL